MCYTLEMPTLRSSDIGNYLFCRRAWWYRRQGLHQTKGRRHGRKVLLAGILRALGLLLLLASLVLLVTRCASGWGA